MSGNAFVVTGRGVAILEADEAWYQFCEKANIKNPFFNIRNTTSDERNQYRRMRDRWVVEWLMENKGYEIAAFCASLRNDNVNDLWWWFENMYPCEYNADCNIFCKNFKNCCKEGFVKWSME